MLFLLPSIVGLVAVVAVTVAYQLGRSLTGNLPVQAGAARMPEGAAHEFA